MILDNLIIIAITVIGIIILVKFGKFILHLIFKLLLWSGIAFVGYEAIVFFATVIPLLLQQF